MQRRGVANLPPDAIAQSGGETNVPGFRVRCSRPIVRLRALHPGYISLLLVATIALAVSAPARARSSGEIVMRSNLMAAKYEACRQEAKEHHLHLVARWRFLRACHKTP